MSNDEEERIRFLFQKLDKKGNGFLDAHQFEIYLNSIEERLHHQAESLPVGIESSNKAQNQRNLGTSSAKDGLTNNGSFASSTVASSAEAVNPQQLARRAYSTSLVKKCDKTLDGTVTFEEFKKFVTEKEKELHVLFSNIAETEFEDGGVKKREFNYVVDSDAAGGQDISSLSKQVVVGKAQLKAYVKKNRIVISEGDLDKFLDAVDRKNDGVIDFTEVSSPS
jgi:Ca2+-binding EF-hand superfamily protein